MLLGLMSLASMIAVMIVQLLPWLWENWAAVAIAFTLGSLVLYVLWLIKACEMRRRLEAKAPASPLPPLGPIVG